jgi:hypothetical protein
MSKSDKHMFSYYKLNNKYLFKTFHTNKQLEVSNTQTYIPIYKKFFNLSDSNFNTIMFNSKYALKSISTIQEDIDEHTQFPDMLKFDNLCVFDASVLNTQNNNKSNNELLTEVFIKYSPLVDPINLIKDSKLDKVNLNYLPQLVTPPEFIEDEKYLKLNSVTNTSYVDGLFTFLSSLLLNKYNVINALQYYGSFLTTKHNFTINVFDDLDFLSELDYFNYLIKDKKIELEAFEEQDAKLKHKPPLIINDDIDIDIDVICENQSHTSTLTSNNLNFFRTSTKRLKHDSLNYYGTNHIQETSLQNSHILNNNTNNINNTNNTNNINNNLDELETIDTMSECSNNSSRYSNTTEGTIEEYQQECLLRNNLKEDEDDDDDDKEDKNDEDDDDKDEEDKDEDDKDEDEDKDEDDDKDEEDKNDEEDKDEDDEDDEEDNMIGLTFPTFPVQLIFMECCDDTLSSLLYKYTKKPNYKKYYENEIIAILMQVVMTLLIYKKAFKFSHNDLHASNIMYVKTLKRFIYYKFEGKLYKVPTFGKIFKIIDFGRATYSINGHEIVGSAFEAGNQAHTQFNYSTCFDPEKPELKPNYSFDLCRLASELYDIFVEDVGNLTERDLESPLIRLVNTWVTDDLGKNIIYKRNGKERHPDFKMYKMISRCVSNHTPDAQLNHDVFKAFIVEKCNENINKKISYLVDIDLIPELHLKNNI